ncbi:hypothetical protein M1N47_03250 [Dehalococcoidia bacterium]|nr:hypothetical protein [Dehalococcoidia bacterium]
MNQKRERQFGLPRPALQRMPVYYRRLMKAIEEGMPFVSSDELGRSAGVPGAQVRKDLSYLSQQGRPGIGYDARSLASHLEEFLGARSGSSPLVCLAHDIKKICASIMAKGGGMYGLTRELQTAYNPA